MNKIILLLSLIFLFTVDCYSQQFGGLEIQQNVIKNGIGLGSVIAVVISWDRNKSVLLAILHGILSWFYVIYYIIVR